MTQTIDQPFFRGLQNELRFERLLPGLTLGVLVGLTEVIFALSVGSLIFSGELAPFLAYGIGIALVTATIMLIGVSCGSSIPGVTGSLQDSPSVILAVIAVALVGALPAAGAQARLATVLVAIAVTTLLTGAFFLALGLFKRGGLVRFLPYPVVGGFLAGTGWLLVRGSFGVMTDFPRSIDLVASRGASRAPPAFRPAARQPLPGDAGYSDRGHHSVLSWIAGDGHVRQ
jgi:SulP family sulfate permease